MPKQCANFCETMKNDTTADKLDKGCYKTAKTTC